MRTHFNLQMFSWPGLSKGLSQRSCPDELPKIIVSESWKGVVGVVLVHLIPISCTVSILWLNLKGEYIGEDFTGPIKSETINLLFLQILAKVHELLITSSLSLIVLHMVRQELLYGEGLPLGLLSSGLAFSQLQYFFGREFWGASYRWIKKNPAAKKWWLLSLLVVVGLTTALVGPASAVLLVPKKNEWVGFGTQYFLPGAQDDFWPIDLTGELQSLQEICNSDNSATLPVCPAGGFASIHEYWSRVNRAYSLQTEISAYSKGMSGSNFFWPIHSYRSQIPARYALGQARKDSLPRSATFLVVPHAAPAVYLRQLMVDWWYALGRQSSITLSDVDDRKAFSTAQSAIVVTRCQEPQTIAINETGVAFPTLLGRFDFAEPRILQNVLLNSTRSDQSRFDWISLPDEFGALSIGGVFQSPWTTPTSRSVIACSVQAGWVPSETTTDEYSFWTGWYPWNITFGARAPFFNAVRPGQPIGKTNGRIAFGRTWLDLLTPRPTHAPLGGPIANLSTIESIFANAGLDGMPDDASSPRMISQDRMIEAVISNVVADGLSRIGSHLIFVNASDVTNGQLVAYQKKPAFDKNILKGQPALDAPSDKNASTTLSVNISISGFTFQKSLALWFAIVPLLVHLVLAGTHTFLVIQSRRTSSSWTLVSELVALAYNSRQHAPSLHNASAAIKKNQTFAQVARLRVRPHAQNSKFDRVELFFEYDGKTTMLLQDDEMQAMVPNSTAVYSVHGVSAHRSSITHSKTWSGPTGHMDATESTESLVPNADNRHILDESLEVVKVSHAYG